MSLHSPRMLRHPTPRPAASPAGRPPVPGFGVERLETRTLFASFAPADAAGLVAAINAANRTPESDTITLGAGRSYTLTNAIYDTNGPDGLPVIGAHEHLTIVGNGATVGRGTAAGTPDFRLFDVAAGDVADSGQPDAPARAARSYLLPDGALIPWYGGGAVYNAGTLALDRVTIRGNTARGASYASWAYEGLGGGIYSSGVLNMTSCLVQNNAAFGGTGGPYYDLGWYFDYHKPLPPQPGLPGGDASGGGVYVAAGSAAVNNCTFYANTATGGAGYYQPISLAGGPGGAGRGGAIYVAGGTVTLHGVGATANTVAGGAGGVDPQSHAKHKPGVGTGGGLYTDAAASLGLDAFTRKHVTLNTASTNGNDIAGVFGWVT